MVPLGLFLFWALFPWFSSRPSCHSEICLTTKTVILSVSEESFHPPLSDSPRYWRVFFLFLGSSCWFSFLALLFGSPLNPAVLLSPHLPTKPVILSVSEESFHPPVSVSPRHWRVFFLCLVPLAGSSFLALFLGSPLNPVAILSPHLPTRLSF